MYGLPNSYMQPSYWYGPWQPRQAFVYPMPPYVYPAAMYPTPLQPLYDPMPARSDEQGQKLEDHGPKPYVVNIEEATTRNRTFRTAIWTGKHLQVTVMSIPVGEDIGLEVHPNTDQFIRIEEGQGLVEMGATKDNLNYRVRASKDDAIMVPAGTWHNVTNTGDRPLQVYSIYAPPQHPFGTVHVTKADAAAERAHE